jgi:hypothetical protein
VFHEISVKNGEGGGLGGRRCDSYRGLVTQGFGSSDNITDH